MYRHIVVSQWKVTYERNKSNCASDWNLAYLYNFTTKSKENLIYTELPNYISGCNFKRKRMTEAVMNGVCSDNNPISKQVKADNMKLDKLNPHLKTYEGDSLFHIGFTSQDDLPAMFGDVKFVCMGGTPNRMKKFSLFVARELGVEDQWQDYTKGERYAIFKSGCVLSVSHGIGKPSASVVLHEIIKLVHYAQCKDAVFIRMGTCGGIDCAAGTVIVTDTAVDEMFRPEYRLPVLGKIVSRPTKLCDKVAEDILSCQASNNNFQVIRGNTLCASDFFEGQARLDGALCEYTEEEKMAYLKQAREAGVRNIEMESIVIAGLCNASKLKAAVVCVALLDRLKSDQVSLTPDQVHQVEQHPMEVVMAYIKTKLGRT